MLISGEPVRMRTDENGWQARVWMDICPLLGAGGGQAINKWLAAADSLDPILTNNFVR